MKRQIKVAFLFLVANLIPVIDAKYHVYGDRNHRAIAGFSLGGLQALASGLSHTELFSCVASFNAAIWAAANPGEAEASILKRYSPIPLTANLARFRLCVLV